MDISLNLPRAWLRAWRAGDPIEQGIVLLLALLFAWLALSLWKRFMRPQDSEERWGIARQKVGVIVFPFCAWAGIWLGIALGKSQHWYQTGLLQQIAAPLLAAMLMIRLLVHTLRRVFGQTNWVLKSERWMSWLIWAGFVLHTVGILQDVWSLLDSIQFKLGKHPISVLAILTAIVTIAVSLLATLWLGSVIEKRLMQVQSMDLNTRVVLNKLVRALLVCAGLLFALQLAGIDLTVFAVFGGALGVGLGFGLQKIASNYISGFIILLDKSLRPGDLVIVDGHKGEITEFTARYIVVKSATGTESIIPNDTLITSTVQNLSYTDPIVRLSLPVQIAYNSDVNLAIKLMHDIALNTPRVLPSPEPTVLLTSFADSGLQLELFICLEDPKLGENALRSAINLQILEQFKIHGIEIPYPRRDVHMINSPAPQQ